MDALELLIGRWRTEARWPPGGPLDVIRGVTTFERLAGGPIVVQRADTERADLPRGLMLLVADADGGPRQHYYDSRGVLRVYDMRLDESVWELHREFPGSQRFIGRFNADRTAIDGAWQQSADGKTWEHDFDLTYTKLGAGDGLQAARVATRLPAQDLERARTFYAEKLGLEPAEERPGGLLYRCAAGEFALFASAGAPSGEHTQMGFEVEDIEATVAALRRRGVVFEHYDLPGLRTVDGIAEVQGNYPSKGGVGERAAWFRDSEGNLLGIGQPLRP